MDARNLRKIDPASFKQRQDRGTSLDTALDDGFAMVERDDLVGKALVLVAWEMTPGISGDYAEVWAIAEMTPDEYVKVKFRDGGRKTDGIPRTLAAMTANGVRENVACTLTGESYEFQDKDTLEWREGWTYRLAGSDVKRAVADDSEPDF